MSLVPEPSLPRIRVGAEVMRRFKLAMVTVGGIGLAPVASGTFGSIPPVVMALALVQADQPE